MMAITFVRGRGPRRVAAWRSRGVQDAPGLRRVVGRSPALKQVLEDVRQVAVTDSTVLLLGETGSGKELFADAAAPNERAARAVDGQSQLRGDSETLIESELFGREKGAFTGALVKQVGRFELADRSTIFLDEIGDLAPDVR